MRNSEPAVLEVKNMQDFLKQLNATPSAEDFREERRLTIGYELHIIIKNIVCLCCLWKWVRLRYDEEMKC